MPHAGKSRPLKRSLSPKVPSPKPPKPSPPKSPHPEHLSRWSPAGTEQLALVGVCLQVLTSDAMRVLLFEEKLDDEEVDLMTDCLIARRVIAAVAREIGLPPGCAADSRELCDTIRDYTEHHLTAGVFEHIFDDKRCSFGEGSEAWVHSMSNRIYRGMQRNDSYRWADELILLRKMEQAENLMELYDHGGICEITITDGAADNMRIIFEVDSGYCAHKHIPTLLFLSLAHEREHAHSRALYGAGSVAQELRNDLHIERVDGIFTTRSDTYSDRMCLGIRKLAETNMNINNTVHSYEHVVWLCHAIKAEWKNSADRRAAAHRLRRRC